MAGQGSRFFSLSQDSARPVDDTIFVIQQPAYAAAFVTVIALEFGLQIVKKAGVNEFVQPVEPWGGPDCGVLRLHYSL